MTRAQDEYPDDLSEMVRWVSEFARPGMRVLEIGCGDGAVTERLAAAGVDVLGVDPDAPDGPNTRVVPLEELDDGPFDVLFASVSLHHLGDPEPMTAALRRVSRPGTVLLVREFDKHQLEHEPTLRWWFHQRLADRAATSGESRDVEDGHEHDRVDSFPDFVETWRDAMDHHVLPWATVRRTIEDAGFDIEHESTGAYLFRWDLGESARHVEEQLIRQGRINAVGVRCRARRRRA